jgi:hypothetical protein
MSRILQIGKGKFRIDLDQTELHGVDGGVGVAGSGPWIQCIGGSAPFDGLRRRDRQEIDPAPAYIRTRLQGQTIAEAL